MPPDLNISLTYVSPVQIVSRTTVLVLFCVMQHVFKCGRWVLLVRIVDAAIIARPVPAAAAVAAATVTPWVPFCLSVVRFVCSIFL
jgi:hypothetical protein